MPRGILYVETCPSSPDQEAEYHKWYDEVHLPEVVAVPGIVAARRYAPVREDGGPFVAIYDLEGDDLGEVLRAVRQMTQENQFQMSDAVELDPPPTMRLLELTASYSPD